MSLVAMIDFLDQVVDRVPNFAGMKFVTFLLDDFGRCMRKYGDRVEISHGKEAVSILLYSIYSYMTARIRAIAINTGNELLLVWLWFHF